MDQIGAMLAFALVTSFTPGPNNTLVTASGANWGFGRTLPHMLGITVGFPAMLLAVGFGVGEIFLAFPQAGRVLRYVAFAYLLYLAWRLARSGRRQADGGRSGRPMSFLEAIAFQWVNPKAWVMALSATTLFAAGGSDRTVTMLALAVIFFAASFPTMASWCLFGKAISRWLDTDRRTALFNAGMAVLLVLSMIPALL